MDKKWLRAAKVAITGALVGAASGGLYGFATGFMGGAALGGVTGVGGGALIGGIIGGFAGAGIFDWATVPLGAVIGGALGGLFGVTTGGVAAGIAAAIPAAAIGAGIGGVAGGAFGAITDRSKNTPDISTSPDINQTISQAQGRGRAQEQGTAIDSTIDTSKWGTLAEARKAEVAMQKEKLVTKNPALSQADAILAERSTNALAEQVQTGRAS